MDETEEDTGRGRGELGEERMIRRKFSLVDGYEYQWVTVKFLLDLSVDVHGSSGRQVYQFHRGESLQLLDQWLDIFRGAYVKQGNFVLLLTEWEQAVPIAQYRDGGIFQPLTEGLAVFVVDATDESCRSYGRTPV